MATKSTGQRARRAFEYAPAPESRAIVDIASSYGLFIGGEFVEGTAGAATRTFKTISPATEEVLSEVTEAGEADVDTAVRAARRAFTRVWSRMPGTERAKYLYRIARILAERSREFAVLESLDNGKPIRESRDVDIPLVSQWFFYYAGWADKLDYAGPFDGAGRTPQPLGVAGQIIPWNFPLMMLAWKIAPALAAGNTVVLKPAETTPLTALLFAQVCQQADLPPGVVNIVTGAGATGQAIVDHPDIDKIAFTGSTAVGKAIARSVAGTTKKVTLELGGKAANIVFDDAPIDQAVEGIVNGIFFNQGHVCCAGSRLLVQESVYEDVLARLKDRMSTLRVGDPLDKNTDVGAINSREQLDRITELSGVGDAEGAERWTAECELPAHGFWFAPTIFTGVTQAHRIAREEIFGPVLSVLTFRTPDEAIAKANNTPYGLSAGVWTEKGSRILAVANRLRAGVVWANTFNKFDPASPFGGYKESGYGREGGKHGLAAYLKGGDR
ncbi:MAG: aldehyde dehydrogenase family protein [Nocardioidaceae bacterium]